MHRSKLSTSWHCIEKDQIKNKRSVWNTWNKNIGCGLGTGWFCYLLLWSLTFRGTNRGELAGLVFPFIWLRVNPSKAWKCQWNLFDCDLTTLSLMTLSHYSRSYWWITCEWQLGWGIQTLCWKLASEGGRGRHTYTCKTDGHYHSGCATSLQNKYSQFIISPLNWAFCCSKKYLFIKLSPS